MVGHKALWPGLRFFLLIYYSNVTFAYICKLVIPQGEYIDITFGALFGITTMAAAAIGNMISDVLGIT